MAPLGAVVEDADYYFNRYADLELQRRMVADRPRTSAFAAAIREVVRPSDVVLDVGTGTGLLALLAAQAGAKTVYAIERSPVLEVARRLFATHPEWDIHLLPGRAANVRPDEKVDVIVSEWLGNLAFVEGMWTEVIAARDRDLRPGGRMIPASVDVYVGLVDDAVLYAQLGPGFWRDPVEGLDLSLLESLELEQARALQLRVEAGALLGPPVKISSIDMHTATRESAVGGRARHSFTIRRDGVMSGLVGWFDAQLSPSVRLDTAPWKPETHWAQTWFPFPPRPVRAGQILELELELAEDPLEPRHVRFVAELDGTRLDYSVE